MSFVPVYGGVMMGSLHWVKSMLCWEKKIRIKLILKLQIIIENQEKEVKKAKPRFSRIDDYFRKYEAKKAELLKFAIILT